MKNSISSHGGPIEGLVAATFTPLHDDVSVDVARIPGIVDHLIDHGISGLYVLGSTGEGVSFTVEERCEVAESFVSAAGGRIPVILQVGSESLAQAKQLAEHAARIGADAISAISPLYFKPTSVESLVESMAEIASAAPKVPFYYYHIPAATHLTHSMVEFLRIGGEEIPSLGGIKFTSPDIEEFTKCVDFAGDDFQVFWGLDELLYEGLTAGAQAAVGSTYNYAAPIHQRLLAAFASGDYAEAEMQQDFVQSIVATFVPFGPREAQKAIMSLIGQDCGPCRLPLRSLSLPQSEDLREKLVAIGFFDRVSKPGKRLTA
jgi:N-acetylneuraminate lyase